MTVLSFFVDCFFFNSGYAGHKQIDVHPAGIYCDLSGLCYLAGFLKCPYLNRKVLLKISKINIYFLGALETTL